MRVIFTPAEMEVFKNIYLAAGSEKFITCFDEPAMKTLGSLFGVSVNHDEIKNSISRRLKAGEVVQFDDTTKVFIAHDGCTVFDSDTTDGVILLIRLIDKPVFWMALNIVKNLGVSLFAAFKGLKPAIRMLEKICIDEAKAVKEEKKPQEEKAPEADLPSYPSVD